MVRGGGACAPEVRSNPSIDPQKGPMRKLSVFNQVSLDGYIANAEGDMYGDPVNPSGGPSGNTCHQPWPASASQSTKA